MVEKVRNKKMWVIYSRLTPAARTRIGFALGRDLTDAWEDARRQFPEWAYPLEVAISEEE